MEQRRVPYTGMRIPAPTETADILSAEAPVSSVAESDAVTAALEREHLQCPLCWSLLHIPLCTPCGHSYCRTCWQRTEAAHASSRTPSSKGAPCPCPVCREPLPASSSVRENKLVAAQVARVLALKERGEVDALKAAAAGTGVATPDRGCAALLGSGGAAASASRGGAVVAVPGGDNTGAAPPGGSGGTAASTQLEVVVHAEPALPGSGASVGLAACRTVDSSGDDAMSQVQAQWLLAERYARGRGVPKCASEAFRLHTLAAAGGHAEAAFAAAYEHHLGSGRSGAARDLAAAVQLYRVAVDEGGHAEAALGLGVLLHDGLGGAARDMLRASELFEEAAEAGLPEGFVELAQMHERGELGIGGRSDLGAAIFYARAAQDADYCVAAKVVIARLHLEGWPGQGRSPSRAVTELQEVLEVGGGGAEGETSSHLATAGFMLAELVEHGDDGVTIDLPRALTLYRDALEGGSPGAALRLSQLHTDGCPGVAVDLLEAERLLRLAVTRGSVQASVALDAQCTAAATAAVAALVEAASKGDRLSEPLTLSGQKRKREEEAAGAAGGAAAAEPPAEGPTT